MILDGLKKEAGIPEEEEIRTLIVRTQLLGEDPEGNLKPLETL
jgi:hypothetical protein